MKGQPDFETLAARVAAWEPDSANYPDDAAARLVLGEAVKSLSGGNYGVGAVILDPNGEVVLATGSRLARPRFRSDGHAEMMALGELEAEHAALVPATLTLVVSLEPCPMCLARIKLSGIGRVRYLADDYDGGMVHLAGRLPPIFRMLHPEQDIRRAAASPEARELARELFACNLESLRRAVLARARGEPPPD
jgi:tRNA(Arg) A34 adenosine deaminase TadA